jgi:hypothetical protein
MKFSSFKFLPFFFLASFSSLQAVTDDASNRPMILENKNEGTSLLMTTLRFGANDRLQVGGGLIGFFEGVYDQSRYQFLGSPQNQGQIAGRAAFRESFTLLMQAVMVIKKELLVPVATIGKPTQRLSL